METLIKTNPDVNPDFEIDLYLTAKEKDMQFKRREGGFDVIYFTPNLDYQESFNAFREVMHMHGVKSKAFVVIISSDHIVYSIDL